MKLDFMESLRMSQEAENEETRKVLSDLALKQFARQVEKINKENEKSIN